MKASEFIESSQSDEFRQGLEELELSVNDLVALIDIEFQSFCVALFDCENFLVLHLCDGNLNDLNDDRLEMFFIDIQDCPRLWQIVLWDYEPNVKEPEITVEQIVAAVELEEIIKVLKEIEEIGRVQEIVKPEEEEQIRSTVITTRFQLYLKEQITPVSESSTKLKKLNNN